MARRSSRPTATAAASRASTAAADRHLPLDVFIGITLAAMVFVNHPGDPAHVYWPLRHAEWDGWTPADLVFPLFLFGVGASIALSAKRASWGAILRRGALIIALGLVVAGYPWFDFGRWRIPGVLQRIGLCYLAAAAVNRVATGDRRRRGAIIMSLAAALAVGYWFVVMHVPPPGGVAGDLSPEGNIGAYIDRALMSGHLWKPEWDPEGLLSTIPAIATTMFGVVAGIGLGAAVPLARKLRQLAVAGIVGAIGGLWWGTVLPIDKGLWTSSYAVFASGVACALLVLCYWTIDVKGWRRWARPFVILGSGALGLLVASELLARTLAALEVRGPDGVLTPVSRHVYVQYFVPLASPANASLLYAFANLVLLFGLLALLYRRRIFLRV